MIPSCIIGRDFSRAAESYDAVADIQREATQWIAQRLPEGRTLDLGCGTGELSRRLRRKIAQLDIAFGMCRKAAAENPVVCADARALPFASRAFDAAASGLMLQWMTPLPALSEAHRVLAPGGRLVAVTLGPRTLEELRQAFEAVDDAPHVHRFPPREELEDALRQAGFGNIAVTEWVRRPLYPDVWWLMRALAALGASNKRDDRRRGLGSREVMRRMEAVYQSRHGAGGEIPATWELFGVEAVKP